MKFGMRNAESLLLDTHIWIWIAGAIPHKIARTVLAGIEAASQRGLVYVSAISVWEAAMLDAKKKIVFSPDIRVWVDRALSAPGIYLVPLSTDISIASTRLKDIKTADPADRIIVATARDLNATLVTCDRAILDVAKTGAVKTIDARP